MNEFDNDNKEQKSEQGSRPDYYQPSGSENGGSSSGTYYTPPKSSENPQNEGSTYHYAYSNNNNNGFNGQSGYQNNQNNPNNQGSYQNSYQSSYQNTEQNSYTAQPDNGSKPPKKSKASKIIIVILVICLVVAGAGIGVSMAGKTTNTDESTTEAVTEEQGDAATVTNSEEVPLVDNEDNYTVAGVADVAMDSCVGIAVYSQQAELYNYFYGESQGSSAEPSLSGEGSGVLMSEKNGKTYVLTCAHVISDGDSFKVTLNDGTEVDAAMVGYDSQTDIGVLSIDKTGLKIAEFADSKNLVVGEQVVAIGCPGGLEFMNSVTSGYISALDRPVSSSIGYDTECIQTDAAINPGNSGGALFNMQGQVIGINSSKIASTEYEGMGFAVPSTTAIDTANSLIKVGYVEGRAQLGIQYNPITSFSNSQTILQALAQEGYKDAEGTMVINSVNSDSDLVNKDIQKYDMIVAVNGKTMTSTDVMTSVLADSKPGDTITLTIARIQDNTIKTFDVQCKLTESKGN